MRSLKAGDDLDEQVFGWNTTCMFNIAAVSDFNMGAMENKGLNVLRRKTCWCGAGTANDGDFLGIELAIATRHSITGTAIASPVVTGSSCR